MPADEDLQTQVFQAAELHGASWDALPTEAPADLSELPASLFTEFDVSVSSKGKLKLKTRNVPSVYQQNVLDHVEFDGGNAVVIATAGSGKTTLLEMVADKLVSLGRVTPDAPAAVMAFNTKIVKVLSRRMPANIQVCTFNSLGQRIIKEAFGETTFDPAKYDRLTRAALDARDYPKQLKREIRGLLKQSLQLSVSNVVYLKSRELWLATMDEFEVNVRVAEDDLYSLTREVIKAGMNELWNERVCSYFDQIYAPYAFNWRLNRTFQTLLIDEGQDLSPGQTYLLYGAVHAGSSILVVGDPAQAIFGFNGATRNSMAQLAGTLNAVTLPLSVSYRCPTRHIEFAREYTSVIEAAPGARQGTLDDVSTAEFVRLVGPADLVLCRTNAPLFSACYALAKHGKPAYIEGKDVASGLVRFARDAAAFDGTRVRLEEVDDDAALGTRYRQGLLAYHQHQKARVEAQAESTGSDAGPQLLTLSDRLEALLLILDESAAQTLGALCEAIKELFKSGKGAVVLSSVHKAKGLEATNVFVIEPQLMPHPSAKTPQALEDERAVQFVAYTRSKHALYIVGNDDSEPVVPAHLRGRQRLAQN